MKRYLDFEFEACQIKEVTFSLIPYNVRKESREIYLETNKMIFQRDILVPLKIRHRSNVT